MYHSFNMIYLFLLVQKRSIVGPWLTCSIFALEIQGTFFLFTVLVAGLGSGSSDNHWVGAFVPVCHA